MVGIRIAPLLWALLMFALSYAANYERVFEIPSTPHQPPARPSFPRPPQNKTIACYFSRYQGMNVSKIPPHLCTHIIYSSALINTTGIVVKSSYASVWKELVKLKKKNPYLKIMVSICSLEIVVGKGPQVTQSFVKGVQKVLQEYDLDGLDLDWEFPGIFRRNEFLELQKALSHMLKSEGKLLSAALPHDLLVFIESYYVEAVNRFFDFMTVMTYDMHYYSPETPYTDYNCPLKESAKVINQIKNIAGVTPSKLLLGYATYARSWKLADSRNHGLHAKAVGVGPAGPSWNSTGIYTLPDICLEVKKGGKIVHDPVNGAEYMYHGDTWVSFNGMYSAQVEAEWIVRDGIGGIGYWSLDYADWNNVCGYGELPVFNKIKEILTRH